MLVVHLQTEPVPNPAEVIGTLVSTIHGVYAVLADRAIILAPAIIEAYIAVERISLQTPPNILEPRPLTLPLKPPPIVDPPLLAVLLAPPAIVE